MTEDAGGGADAPTVLIIGDPAYLRHLRALAASIRRLHEEWRLHFHLVNVGEAERSSLAAEFPAATLSAVSREFASEEEKRAYCANCRASVMVSLFGHAPSTVIYFDADSLVRRPLDGLLALAAAHDVLVHSRPERERECEKVASGVVVARNTPGARRFVESWAARIERGPAEWFADQLALHSCQEELRGEMSIGHLPSEFIDWEFRGASPVWVGKGPRKYESGLYRIEEELHLRRLEGRSTFPGDLLLHTRLCMISLAIAGRPLIHRLLGRRSGDPATLARRADSS